MSATVIRQAREEDFPAQMALYEDARRFMAESGNPRQWGPNRWPPEELIRRDTAAGHGYVCETDGQITGTFFFDAGEEIEPTYSVITEGGWIGSGPYGVVHRIAAMGCGRICLEWAFAQCGHLRVDTHPDNRPMQRLLDKCGFVRCGIIHVPQDSDPRLAYEKIR